MIEFEQESGAMAGTWVRMEIATRSGRTLQEIIKKYALGPDDYGFAKTHIPVKLANYEGDFLVSRSQAKRLLARFDRFKEVLLDFSGVQMIGQGFADEIFRVFRHSHPEVALHWIRASDDVEKMIWRAWLGDASSSSSTDV